MCHIAMWHTGYAPSQMYHGGDKHVCFLQQAPTDWSDVEILNTPPIGPSQFGMALSGFLVNGEISVNKSPFSLYVVPVQS
jgi:hypothetical protein